MPVDGHPPGVDRGFGLKVCVPCGAGDHRGCRRIWDRPKRRFLFCECTGWTRQAGQLVILPCLQPKENHDAR